jgi:hypothetical protein
MKTIFFSLLALAMQLQAVSQNDSLQQRYIDKSKSQKSGAKALLFGGIALVIIGTIVYKPAKSTVGAFAGEEPSMTGPIIMGIGFVAMAGSIPLFIASSKNKKRASVSVSNSFVPRLQSNGIAYTPLPALNFCLQL